jgi:hypothetical protein
MDFLCDALRSKWISRICSRERWVTSFGCSLHGDSSVRSYLDCAWVSTDILRRNSLDTPEDSDIVIGYLFMVSTLPILCRRTSVRYRISKLRGPIGVEMQFSQTAQPIKWPSVLGIDDWIRLPAGKGFPVFDMTSGATLLPAHLIVHWIPVPVPFPGEKAVVGWIWILAPISV